jgi:hypothetical protein
MKMKSIRMYTALTCILTDKPVALTEEFKKEITKFLDEDYANDKWYVIKVGDGVADICSDIYQYRYDDVPLDKLMLRID